MDEVSYIQGSRVAWSRMLGVCMGELGYKIEEDDPEVSKKVRWAMEREAAIAELRDVCGDYGDNDWDEELHLADIIEKHLGRHLRGEKL